MDLLIDALYQNWRLLFFVFILYLIYFFINKPSFKGKLGEWFVNKRLESRIDQSECIILKNIILPTEDGTTEIDHIIVAPSGIWVLETKFYNGWIFGSKNGKLWTQKFLRSSRKFQNPFHQNYKHCKTIAEHTGINEKHIHNNIILLGEFKSDPIKGLYTRVTSFMIQFERNKNVVIEDVEAVVEMIWSIKLDNTRKNKKEHIKHVKEIIEKKENISCRHCGNKDNLILKKGYSEYYHCPKCKKNTSKN